MPMEWTHCLRCGLRVVAIGGALALLTGCRAQVAPDLGDYPPIAEDPADRDTKSSADSESSSPAVAARSVPHRRARDKDKLLTITFDDLKVNIQADQLFEASMATDRVRELDGQRVRIRGFLFPAIFQQTGIKSFPLVMNTDCKFGPGEQAHHVILVELIDGASTSYTVRPIMVTGRLALAPWTGPDGNTWALYHIAGERVD